MEKNEGRAKIVYTDNAECRDCYRCIRVCPVKAIRMDINQALIVPERCISCGTCIRECPQGAKKYRNDIYLSKIISDKSPLPVAIVAPSYMANFEKWQAARLPSALRRLGFKYVHNVGESIRPVMKRASDYIDSTLSSQANSSFIYTSCPASISYIEKYRPEFIDSIIPVISPMISCGKAVKELYGKKTRVVFIGPCVAKKDENLRDEYKNIISSAMTFEELDKWMESEGVDFECLEESNFDQIGNTYCSDFPLPGGAVGLINNKKIKKISVNGFIEFDAAFDYLRSAGEPVVMELLFCKGGCPSGPGSSRKINQFAAWEKLSVNNMAENNDYEEGLYADIDYSCSFCKQYDFTNAFSEEAIIEVLSKTGKANPEDRPDCGACGYNSCREKAIAVLSGMAVPEMCMPYMRRKAETRSNKIMDTSPNGIIILDEHLRIKQMNPAFRKMFLCNDSICGKHLSYLIDPEPFVKLKESDSDIYEIQTEHENYNLICHQIHYKLHDDGKIVGIFVNVTNHQNDKEILKELKNQTLRQAKELLDHQINMAQNFAKMLGENTAKGEQLVEQLMEMAGNEKNDKRESQWDIFTAK